MAPPSHDVIVIGAGPAGLTAATEAARAGLKAFCLDKLAPGDIWRQSSIVGSVFAASYELVDGQVVPTLRGRAHLSADATLLIEDDDPFAFGIQPGLPA